MQRLIDQRRVFDSGYYASLHNENVDLIQDDGVATMTADSVVTGKGVEVKADVVVLCTGFKVQDCESRSTAILLDPQLTCNPQSCSLSRSTTARESRS
jgi:cation diffusion facilitator CzcD-associated flavoprotein CzcO